MERIGEIMDRETWGTRERLKAIEEGLDNEAKERAKLAETVRGLERPRGIPVERMVGLEERIGRLDELLQERHSDLSHRLSLLDKRTDKRIQRIEDQDLSWREDLEARITKQDIELHARGSAIDGLVSRVDKITAYEYATVASVRERIDDIREEHNVGDIWLERRVEFLEERVKSLEGTVEELEERPSLEAFEEDFAQQEENRKRNEAIRELREKVLAPAEAQRRAAEIDAFNQQIDQDPHFKPPGAKAKPDPVWHSSAPYLAGCDRWSESAWLLPKGRVTTGHGSSEEFPPVSHCPWCGAEIEG